MFDDPPVDAVSDFRPLLFEGAAWYEEAVEPGDDGPIAVWRLVKARENAWWVQLLNAAFSFAIRHDLVEVYRTRFAGIRSADLTPERAQAAGRSVLGPIWEIANELVAACYLERVHGWRFERHEPRGRNQHRGDWQFITPNGHQVFVEVKSLAERDWSDTGPDVFMRPDYRPRIRDVLKGAYAQLPDDERSTFVVLVGHEMLSIPVGIMHGDLFQALFGQMQVSFPVGAEFSTAKVRLGPSFRDMLVQHAKNRRLGCAAGLFVSGCEAPGLKFYSIHNPWAHSHVRLPSSELGDGVQFVFDEDGFGREFGGVHPREAWARMARP